MLQRIGVVLALAVVTAGCAGPKVITHATGDKSHVRFLRFQKQFIGSDQEVIRCNTGADGSLSQCKSVAMKFED